MTHTPPMDSRFRVELIAQTPDPQTVVWAGMHQDYCVKFVADLDEWPSEERAGEICIHRLLAGERGHYGPLEHPQITLNVGWFPHSVMQQARTHRVGVSFDCQSFRYTSSNIIKAAEGDINLEEVFYLRPLGVYGNRQGKKYEYTKIQRIRDLDHCYDAARLYAHNILEGMAEEQARGILPFDYRQHFVVSFSLRAFLHFFDLRAKMDAQLEIRQLCELMFPHLEIWAPQFAEWYRATRYRKAMLAP